MENNTINQYIDAILGKECSVCPHNAQCEKGLTCDKNKAYSKMIIAGAEWQAKQDPWISIDERMPEDNQLVLTSSGIYGTKLLVWNAFHGVWDDEDGDDVYCERDKIDAWMPIPE